MTIRPIIPDNTVLWAMSADALAHLGRAHGIRVRRMASRAARIAALAARREALAVCATATAVAVTPAERLASLSELSDAELATAVAGLLAGRLQRWALCAPWGSLDDGYSWRAALGSRAGTAAAVEPCDFAYGSPRWRALAAQAEKLAEIGVYNSLVEARRACDEDLQRNLCVLLSEGGDEQLEPWMLLMGLAASRCELPEWLQLREILLTGWELRELPTEEGQMWALSERLGERPLPAGSVAAMLAESLLLGGLVAGEER